MIGTTKGKLIEQKTFIDQIEKIILILTFQTHEKKSFIVHGEGLDRHQIISVASSLLKTYDFIGTQSVRINHPDCPQHSYWPTHKSTLLT